LFLLPIIPNGGVGYIGYITFTGSGNGNGNGNGNGTVEVICELVICELVGRTGLSLSQ